LATGAVRKNIAGNLQFFEEFSACVGTAFATPGPMGLCGIGG
jgi:hypothetical protein